MNTLEIIVLLIVALIHASSAQSCRRWLHRCVQDTDCCKNRGCKFFSRCFGRRHQTQSKPTMAPTKQPTSLPTSKPSFVPTYSPVSGPVSVSFVFDFPHSLHLNVIVAFRHQYEGNFSRHMDQ
jgi:hypothetical protein